MTGKGSSHFAEKNRKIFFEESGAFCRKGGIEMEKKSGKGGLGGSCRGENA